MKINNDSPQIQKDFKLQYDKTKIFNPIRYEIFDKPIQLVSRAFLLVQDDTPRCRISNYLFK